jgi:MFS family permease
VRPRAYELAILIALFLDMVGFTMLIPDIQLRAETFLGVSTFKGPIIGFLLQITFVIQIVASPRWGRFADRTGRRRVFIACQILSAIAMLIYGFATQIEVLFVSRILAGFGAANVATGQAIAASLAGPERKRTVMGWVSAALSGGMIFGPAIGGYLANSPTPKLVGLAGALISLVGVLLIVVFVRDDAKEDVPAPEGFKWLDFSFFQKNPLTKSFFYISAIASFALATLEGTFGRLIHQLLNMGTREFGIVFSYEAVLGVLMSAFGLVWLGKRICETTLLRLGYVFQGTGLLVNTLAGVLSSFMPGMVCLLVASTLYALGVGVVNPTLSALSSNAVSEKDQGELFGILQSARTIGFAIGPIIGGALFDRWFALPYILASLVCFGVALFLPAICTCHPKRVQTT